MISTQVLIIGAGPVGMVSAIRLAQAGIHCVLVDKRLDRLDAPKAHAVNALLNVCPDSWSEKGVTSRFD